MGRRSAIHERLSYSNVVATLALVIAVGTGGAWAAGQIGSSDIKRNAVLSKHIRAKQVKSSDLATSSVTHDKLACKGNSAADKMVRAGSVCIDKYEASVWNAPTGGTQLTTEAQIDAACPNNGQGCANFYARSVPGVVPASRITWFQAQQALANSGKQLPTNAEWQAAVSGTPDSSACNVAADPPVTGANPGCVSRFGAFDMVGSVAEWVGDWDEVTNDCDSWPPAEFGTDDTCVGAAPGTASTADNFPGGLARGGSFLHGTGAGPFTVRADFRPSEVSDVIGFRGAR